MGNFNPKRQRQLPPSIYIWRVAQIASWLVGLYILYNLIFHAAVGLNLFWNILITLAPAILVLATGAWRNLCPMATTALFPSRRGFARRKRLTRAQISRLNLVAVIALFILVPLRHAIFDTNGLATAFLIMGLATIAVFVGIRYEWKSAWCAGLCPIYPVEKLYGSRNSVSLPNIFCQECYRCVTPCPDITPGLHLLSVKTTVHDRLAGVMMVGAFPGFVWGWFQVPSTSSAINPRQLLAIFVPPLFGLVVTTLLFLALRRFVPANVLVRLFSAAAVSCYYWFRLPAFFGFGSFPGAGVVLDLSGKMPAFFMPAITLATTAFFVWWIVLRKQKKTGWLLRPVHADKET